MSEKNPPEYFPPRPRPAGIPPSQGLPRIGHSIGALQQVPSLLSPSGQPEHRPSPPENAQYQHQQQKGGFVPKDNSENLVSGARASDPKADPTSGFHGKENPPPAEPGTKMQ